MNLMVHMVQQLTPASPPPPKPKERAKREPKAQWKTFGRTPRQTKCSECGTKMVAAQPNVKTCGPVCRLDRLNRMRREWRAKHHDK